MFASVNREIFSKNSLISFIGVTVGTVAIFSDIKRHLHNLAENNKQVEMLLAMSSTMIAMRIGYKIRVFISNETKNEEESLCKYATIIGVSSSATLLAIPITFDITNHIIWPVYDELIDYSKYLYNKLESVYDVL